MQIGIGTAQFGLQYGISNTSGQISPYEAHKILDLMIDKNFSMVDTAPAYGDAEEIIGSFPSRKKLKLVTKTAQLNSEEFTKETTAQILSEFKSSLQRLNVDTVYGLLIHNICDLKKPGFARLADNLSKLRDDGLIQKLGVSAYSIEDIHTAHQHLDINLAQVPINVFDQKFNTPETIAFLEKTGVEVHARSVFLQGLLLQPVEAIQKKFHGLLQMRLKLADAARAEKLTELELALSFLHQVRFIDVAIVGVSTFEEFKQIMSADFEKLRLYDWTKFKISDPEIIDPRLW